MRTIEELKKILDNEFSSLEKFLDYESIMEQFSSGERDLIYNNYGDYYYMNYITLVEIKKQGKLEEVIKRYEENKKLTPRERWQKYI